MTLEVVNIISSLIGKMAGYIWNDICFQMQDVVNYEFSGWDLVKFYLNVYDNYYADYSWQIVLSFTIMFYCILMLVTLFFMFWVRVWKESYRKRKKEKLAEYFSDKFRLILGSAEQMDEAQIYEVLGLSEEEIRKNDSYYYASLLEDARMSMYEIVFLPNMQVLAEVLGVTSRFELQLQHGKDVFRTLQMLIMLQITVSEGWMANYINHTNSEIRMMARLNHITCSKDAPYRYLLHDLNEPQSLFRPMMLNYIFGWMMYQERHMPNFLNLADRVKNEDSAAYLVHEVAYWGKENEKEEVRNYFLDPRSKVRSAAIGVCIALNDEKAEDKLIESYTQQPEHIRQEVLKALLAINSGKHTNFFKKAYEMSASRETRSVALHCLYQYGNSGRRLFEIMRSEADEDTRKLIDQIDAQVLLAELQTL